MINIFVEGIGDEKFLKDYLSFLGIENNRFEIINTKSKDKLIVKKPLIERNTDLGGINLIIFDADNDLSKRIEFYLKLKEDNKLDFELFLFPNNKSEGDLEILLENIILEDNKDILNCWNTYEDCIINLDKGLTIPANKTKIYAYLEVLLDETQEGKKKIKDRSRDYKNEKHWNLNSDYLLSLKEFLLNSFNK